MSQVISKPHVSGWHSEHRTAFLRCLQSLDQSGLRLSLSSRPQLVGPTGFSVSVTGHRLLAACCWYLDVSCNHQNGLSDIISVTAGRLAGRYSYLVFELEIWSRECPIRVWSGNLTSRTSNQATKTYSWRWSSGSLIKFSI